MTDSNLTQLLKHHQYGLLGLTACLYSIYLVLVWRVGDLTHLGVSGLFMLAALTLIWEHHTEHRYRFERGACLLAALLIGWMLWQSLGLTVEHHRQLRLFPFTAALAVALVASGFQGLRQYRRELALMFFLGVPSFLLSLVDISPLTATATTGLLRLGEFNVVQDGVALNLPVGVTVVHSGCSGVESIAYLLGIAVICLTLYPVERTKQISALVAACLISFGVNSVRIAVMATLAAPQDQQELIYWSEGDGSLAFGVAMIVLFAGFYWLLYRLEISQVLRHQERLRAEQHQSESSTKELK
jgi:cyanoexosortase A